MSTAKKIWRSAAGPFEIFPNPSAESFFASVISKETERAAIFAVILTAISHARRITRAQGVGEIWQCIDPIE